MKISRKIKLTTHKKARQEDQEYFLQLSPIERLREVHRMRVLNYGEAANKPMKRIITIIK